MGKTDLGVSLITDWGHQLAKVWRNTCETGAELLLGQMIRSNVAVTCHINCFPVCCFLAEI